MNNGQTSNYSVPHVRILLYVRTNSSLPQEKPFKNEIVVGQIVFISSYDVNPKSSAFDSEKKRIRKNKEEKKSQYQSKIRGNWEKWPLKWG